MKPKLVGGNLASWEQPNHHVNVILRNLIITPVSIGILDNAKDDALNAFDDLNFYHETSDIASAQSVILLDEFDLLQPKIPFP